MARDDEYQGEIIIGEVAAPLKPAAHLRVASLSVVGLLVLLILYTIYFAKPFLMPFVFSLLLALVLRPIHCQVTRTGLPAVPSAIAVMIMVVGLTLLTLYALSGPVIEWATMLPHEIDRVQDKLQTLREPVERVTEVAAQMDELASMEESPTGPPVVEVQQQQMSEKLLDQVVSFSGYLAVVMVLAFFILAFGDAFYRQLGRHDETVTVFHEISDSVSKYLFTITVINIGLGVCVGAAMALVGMPNPVLWGVIAAVLNFIPFLGAMVGIVVVALAAAITLDSVAHIVAVPSLFFLCTAIEGNFITPTILGRRFTVNPIVLFVWTLLWGWIWGVPGALLAVPLMMALKIVFDHVPQLCWISELISYRPIIGPPKRQKEEPEENCAIHVARR